MKRRIKSRIASWRIGEYIRQLSVVTLGVVITFVGSDMISEYNTQQRLKTALQLTKSDLMLKRDDVLDMKKRYDAEVSAAQYLQKYKNRIEEANADTLERCIRLPFQSTRFIFADDAMEMLKTSGLFQQIKNQEIATQLIKTNGIIKGQSYGNFNFYADNKTKQSDKIEANNPTFAIKYDELLESNASTFDKARFLLQYQEFRDVSTLPLFFLQGEQFLVVVDAIDRMIERLDKEYGLD